MYTFHHCETQEVLLGEPFQSLILFEDKIRIHECNVRLIFWEFRQNHGHCEEWACPGIQMTHCSMRQSSCNWGICAPSYLLMRIFCSSITSTLYLTCPLYLKPFKFQLTRRVVTWYLGYVNYSFFGCCYVFAWFGYRLIMTAL